MREIGSLVDGKYKILAIIGQGGMSVVYLAINERANKQWAIKEIRKDGIKDFEVIKQSLIAEASLLKRLSHPGLPSEYSGVRVPSVRTLETAIPFLRKPLFR